MIFYLLVILLLTLLIIYYIHKNENIENFNSHQVNNKNECTKIDNQINFCNWDNNDKKCYCSYQPGLAYTNFPQIPTCCNESCSELSEDECQRDNIEGNIKYYCPINSECQEFMGYKTDTKISANTCGIDKLNYQTIYPFLSKRDCQLSINQCDLYNNSNLTASEQKEKCLQQTFCGWCTNNLGVGKCIEGTASGPNDIYKYNFCKIGNSGSNNSYTHGSNLEFNIQS